MADQSTTIISTGGSINLGNAQLAGTNGTATGDVTIKAGTAANDNLVLGGPVTAKSLIDLEAGGDITLNGALTVTDPNGTLILAPGGNLYLGTAAGFSAGVFQINASGNINLTFLGTTTKVGLALGGTGNLGIKAPIGSIELTTVTARNGSITVNAKGNVVADDVELLTNATGNDITLTSQTGSVTAAKVNAGSLGDVT